MVLLRHHRWVMASMMPQRWQRRMSAWPSRLRLGTLRRLQPTLSCSADLAWQRCRSCLPSRSGRRSIPLSCLDSSQSQCLISAVSLVATLTFAKHCTCKLQFKHFALMK